MGAIKDIFLPARARAHLLRHLALELRYNARAEQSGLRAKPEDTRDLLVHPSISLYDADFAGAQVNPRSSNRELRFFGFLNRLILDITRAMQLQALLQTIRDVVDIHMCHAVTDDIDSGRDRRLEGDRAAPLDTALHQRGNFARLDTNDAANRPLSNVGILRAHVLHGAEEHPEG